MRFRPLVPFSSGYEREGPLRAQSDTYIERAKRPRSTDRRIARNPGSHNVPNGRRGRILRSSLRLAGSRHIGPYARGGLWES